MKKINLNFTVLMFVVFMFAGKNYLSAQQSSLAQINFDKTEHDYGTMAQGSNGEAEFKFTNTGTEPLVLNRVHGCCGVTITDWTKSPINPGESGNVKLIYQTSRVGVINKTITVYSNASNNPTAALRLKGNINFDDSENKTHK